VVIFLSSCKTYYIPIGDFKKQFAGIDSSGFKKVTTLGPYGERVKYLTFPLEYVTCIDKKGRLIKLKISPSLEIRFTDFHNKGTVFYFDRISVDRNAISGVQSRFISGIRKQIPISTVKTIEVQDGRKRYKYVDQ